MENKNYLRISEKFYSIQGEGVTIGMRAIFLRLGGCNLLCESNSWTCDTIEVWSKSEKVNFEDVFDSDDIQKFKFGCHLIITGGEPLLHQKMLTKFLIWFRSQHGFLPIIEIETNGTIIPKQYLLERVNYWNVSPKLANSGEPFSKRHNRQALESFALTNKAIFKFVINNINDFSEITEHFNFIKRRDLVLMTAGDSRESLHEKEYLIVKLALDYGCRYSSRLQVHIWNKTTGV